MRGFLGGFLVGAVSAVVIAAMALLVQPARQPEVTSSAPPGPGIAGGGGETGEAGPPVPPDAGRDADLVAAMPTVPDTAEDAASDAPPALKPTDRQPAGRPAATIRAGDLSAPASAPADAAPPPQAPRPGADPDRPAATGPDGMASPPAPEPAPGPSPEPADPGAQGALGMAAPQPGDAVTAPPAVPPAPGDMSEEGPEMAAASSAAAPVPAPDVDVAAPARRPARPGPESRPAPATEAARLPQAAPAPVVPVPSAAPGSAPVAPPAPSEALRAPSAAPAAPSAGVGDAPARPDVAVAAAPQEGGRAARGGQHAPRMAELPRVGGDAGDSDVQRPGIGTPVVPLTERDGAAGTGAQAKAPARPPLVAFAAPYENPRDLPLMSIVLIDDADSFGAEALAEFPYPLTFAVDPASPQAAEKMARHRANGFEVVVLADLPRNSAPEDAAAAVEAWLARLPEAVAVLEGPVTGIQGDRAVAERVTDVVRRSGHGLILQNRGLNTAQKLAAREGVPSAVVFRDFDGAGQTPVVMRRFLDQAAFRARQEGAVIMLGRLRPDTISALVLWGLQDRASRVALVPVSAVLTRHAR